MTDQPTPFRDFLVDALERAGLDRKALAHAMGTNPGKFYRRFDAWLNPRQVSGPRDQVPDLPTARRLAEVLGAEVPEVMSAIRAHLATVYLTMSDKGEISPLPPASRPAPFVREVVHLESLLGWSLEPDLRANPDLMAGLLTQVAGWGSEENAFERLLAEAVDDAPWYLFFGGLLELAGPARQEAAFFAWLRPWAIRTPVLWYQHGFGFAGFVAADIPSFLDLCDRDAEAELEVIAPADAGLRDLTRSAWVIQRLWRSDPHRLILEDASRSEDEEPLSSALADPFLVRDTPAALYWLMRCELDGDEEGSGRLGELLQDSPARMVRDAARRRRPEASR
jgi:hypothetical protein